MTPLPDLIGYHERRAIECADEITELVNRFNKRVEETRHYDENDLRRMAGVWRQERRIACDTVSWLKTIQARKSSQ